MARKATQTTRTRQTLPPATGATNLKQCGPYWIVSISTETPKGTLTQEYMLSRLPDPTLFILSRYEEGAYHTRIVQASAKADGWTCDCEDAKHREERSHCCKHINAIKALLAQKKLR